MENKQQFKFDFNKTSTENKLQTALKNGDFTVFFEINSPEKDCNFSTVLSRWKPFIEAVEKIEGINTGLVFTDKKIYKECYETVNFASELCGSDRDRHIIFLSGRSLPKDGISEAIDAILASGFSNIVAVSGDSLAGETYRETQKMEYAESIQMLKILQTKYKNSSLYYGSVVNPFKYTPSTLYSQYFKLIKKINLGSGYIIAQTGWDLLKFQELRWYLERRGFFEPTIARLLFLNPENMEEIVSGKNRGIHISPDFLSILKKESKFGLTQFMSAQLRRLQFLIAGLKFLGYSGVVIAGIEKATEVNVVGNRILEVLKEFNSFKDWREGYLSYLGRAEMAPYPYRFFLYKNLFEGAYSEIAEEKTVDIPNCSRTEKIKYQISDMLLRKSGSNMKITNFLFKKLIAGCSLCKLDKCSLSGLYYVCPMKCPKKMLNGPCGGSKANGNCEITNKECIHSRIFRLANWRKTISEIEEKYIF